MPVLSDARQVISAIRQVSDPDAVILFGSVAREAEGRDIDLLIIGKKADEKKITTSLYPFHKRFALDTFFVTKKKLRDLYYGGSPFLRLIQREGRVLYMKDSLKEWHESAMEDPRQAEYLCDGGFYRGACYSGQQSVEKLIKWALIKKGWELEKIHNVRRLMALAEDMGVKVALKDEELDFIDSIYRGRYPGEEARKALQIARKVVKQIE